MARARVRDLESHVLRQGSGLRWLRELSIVVGRLVQIGRFDGQSGCRRIIASLDDDVAEKAVMLADGASLDGLAGTGGLPC